MTEEKEPLVTEVGMADVGTQVVVRGRDLHHDCVQMSFFEYLAFAVGGASLTPSQLRVLEKLWIGTGYPDPRIWCNRVAGYLGSARTEPAQALCAALAASNGMLYGFRALAAAYALQTTIPTDETCREEWLGRQLDAGVKFVGYGRPFHGKDERIFAGLSALAEEGLRAGPALARAFWLHKQLLRLKGVQLNAAGLWAAISIDFGMSFTHFTEFHLLMFVPGYMAVYGEQRRRPAFTFHAR